MKSIGGKRRQASGNWHRAIGTGDGGPGTERLGLMPVASAKTLVLFPGALGDFLCFYPTLEWLRRRTPASSLEIRLHLDLGDLLGTENQRLVVQSLDSPEVRSLFIANAQRNQSLWNFFDRFDEIYSWTGFRDETFRENLMTLAPGKAHLFPFRPETSGDRMRDYNRMRDYYLSCVDASRTEQRDLRLAIRPAARAWANDYLEERGISHLPLLALAPGSGAMEKNWPFEHFAAVCEWWHASAKGVSLLITGPVERERWHGVELACSGSLSVGDLSLGQVAALFERCGALVGNDSGTTHLAAAVGIPTFAIFGPTDPLQWKPWGPKVTVVASGLSCAPCGSTGMKACRHRNCLRDLQPEVLIRLLEQNLLQGVS
jgi:hypothetical protein